ncbi:MAG: peptidoglycan biosynthesis protein MviN/MurJ (putative lipid II flippase) [Bradymonadia bacterium]|jgi:peptidoglycan biosynthesis protein MviN/MurJ (putative lipid II flippase)
MLVPAAMVGQAIGQAAFAFLSRMRAEAAGAGPTRQLDATQELSTTLKNVVRATAALAMLTAAGVWATADASVRFAFLRGAYEVSDAERTTELLKVLAWAVPGWSLYTVGAKALQAAERTWLSAGLGLGTLVPSWFVYQQLAGSGTIGLAWATVICVSTASLLSVGFLRGTYGLSLLPSAFIGLLEGSLLGAVGAGAAYLVAFVSPEPALIRLTIQGAAFVIAAGGLLTALPGPAGDLVRRRLRRLKR